MSGRTLKRKGKRKEATALEVGETSQTPGGGAETGHSQDLLAFEARALAQVGDAVIAVDNHERVTYMNDAAASLYGVDHDRPIGYKLTDVYKYEWLRPEDEKEATTALAQTGKWTGERVHFKSNGESIVARSTVSVLKDASGQPIGRLAVVRDVTENWKAQQELKNMAKFPIENPDPVIRLAEDGRVLFCNPAGLHLLSSWGCELGGHAPDRWRALVADALGSGKKKEVEEKYGQKTFLFSVVPISTSDYVNIYGRDISKLKETEEALRKAYEELDLRVHKRTEELQAEVADRKRAEEAVTAQQKRLVDILEMLPVYLILLTPDYHVSYANRFFRDRFGEDHGKRCFEYLFGRTKPCDDCQTYEVLKTNAPHRWEWSGPDGRAYQIHDFLFVDIDGSRLILEVGVDITERKAIEEKLRSSSLYVRSLIEASLDPLVTISAEGRITDVNEATEHVTGFSRDQLIGSDFSDYFTEPEKAREGYQLVLRHGSVKDYPLAVQHASGRITDLLYNATTYKNEAGEVQGVFAAARDITERKAIEEKLKEAERLAAIGQTAAMVGHDIRNPLQSIEGAAYLARQELTSLPAESGERKELEELLNIVEDQTRYIDHIVADLQDFARTAMPQSRESDLRTLITESLAMTTVPKEIELHTDFQENLQNAYVDPVFMKRVLVNLIENAIQAMSRGGKLTLKVLSNDDAVSVLVEDTGVGIPEEDRERIFTPLFTTKAKGQGLGLAVCRKLVEAQGGTVTFESELGKGTKFIVRLPLTKDGV